MAALAAQIYYAVIALKVHRYMLKSPAHPLLFLLAEGTDLGIHGAFTVPLSHWLNYSTARLS